MVTKQKPSKKLIPIHPGEILLEEYLKPKGISVIELSKGIRVQSTRINEIVSGKRSITPTIGRPKGSGKVGRPKGVVGASKGFLAGAVAKQVKPLLRAQSKAIKVQVKALVAQEVAKAIKAALR
jgi:hypothetical protein